MWEAIKSIFGGNDESKKMQKYLLKQQFEGFSVSALEGLHKGYDRFQTLMSQLEIHGAGVSHEDANQKFLRSIPSSWSQVALIMRTKPGLDTLSFDDLYNNLRVFERDVKGTTTSSSSNTQNVAFMSADNTSSTNDVSTAYSVSSPSVSKSQKEGSSSYTDKVIRSFFANQSCAPQLHFARDYKAKRNQNSKRKDDGYNGNKAKDNGRRPAYQDDTKALVTINGEDIDWSGYVEEDAQNYVMMAYSSSNSGSDNESVFMNKESDLENTFVNDRYAEGMHAVPPHMTGIYMPSGLDVEIDYSKFIYGPKQTLVDESDANLSEYTSCESDSSVETTTSMPAPVENAPKVICEPKVWTNAPIIKEYESYSDDDLVCNVQEDIEKPSFTFTDSVKHVKSPRENVKETGTPNHIPKVVKQDRHSPTRKGLGYAFTRKACFVCGSFNHLIRDCDFHEKRMAKQAELTKRKNKVTGQKVNRPVWNNVQRVNHQNKHMAGNKVHLADYQEFKGGSVAFGGSNGRITGKGKIKAIMLDFEDVYYVEDLKNYNLFSVSQMCDKKNKVLFADTDCLVLSPNFKLPDENQVLLKIPRQQYMYSFNLKNIDPSGDLACLFTKASIDESNKWHRILGLVNFKNLNNLLKGNLVRGLPSKIFKNDHTCVVCQKGKQHEASWIKMEYSNARTPQQNRVAKRKNMTFIEAARTMLADSFLPTTFWAEIINTACYVPNRVLVTKPQNKTPYEHLISKQPIISYLRPFGCHVTILNTIDQLAKFDGKSDSGFLVGYSLNSKAFGVYNLETKRVEENLHVNFLENNPNVAGKGHAWMFDLDYLTNSLNYEPILVENQANKSASPKEANNILPIWPAYSTTVKSSGDKIEKTTDVKISRKKATNEIQNANTNNTNLLNVVSKPIRTASPSRAFNDGKPSYPDDPSMPHLEDIYASPSKGIFTDSSYDDEGMDSCRFSLWKKAIKTKWVYRNKKDKRGVVVRNKERLVTQGHRQEERIDYDEVFAHVARIEAIRIFLAFAFYMGFIVYQIDVKSGFLYGTIDEEVYVTQPPGFVDPKFPNKVYKVVKALYGLHQAPRAWYATLSTFLEKDDIIFGSTKKSWHDEFEELMKNRFQMSSMGELTFFLGLQVKHKEDGIFISQDKYVAEILKKFDFLSVKTNSTPIETQKPLVKNKEAADVDVHLYRYLKGQPKLGLWYPKGSLFELEAYSDNDYAGANLDRKSTTGVKRIFRYLKGKPFLGLWYPNDSPFNLVAYSDSDYAGASLDRKSTTGGCQFLGCRLISWQCKKQTVVATSSAEAEYVAAASGYAQVLWI
nr:retrovirus-related Pol polyprotein from transposon TNT 1-94 [Tanacetum cinerariifolium]